MTPASILRKTLQKVIDGKRIWHALPIRDAVKDYPVTWAAIEALQRAIGGSVQLWDSHWLRVRAHRVHVLRFTIAKLEAAEGVAK